MMAMKKIKMQLPEMSDYLMAEGLNQLKTNLAFSGDGIQMITVTSSVPNEGKSSVAFNLARTMAENGKKILLVDCDLRKSVMAAKYRMEGIEKGFSHYLTGQAGEGEVIYETDLEGFYITVAGPLSPDPTSLLNSELFDKFMKRMRSWFDFVIVDAPPLGLVIDAVIIGQHTNGTVVVIEQGVIKRRIIQDVVNQLKKGNIRILGAVLNKVDERTGVYGNYKYGYGYYGEEKTKTIRDRLKIRGGGSGGRKKK